MRRGRLIQPGNGAAIPLADLKLCVVSDSSNLVTVPTSKMAEQPQIFSGISDDDKRGYESLYKQGGREASREYYREKDFDWKKMPLNVGIVGNSGSGKSSFINAIRGLTGDDEGAAEVGVTETNTQPIPYAHPKNEQLKFWDLPGVGTPNFPKEGYLEKIVFAKFDFFLVITDCSFTENDRWLANEISKEGKQYFILRTKVDLDLQNDKHSHPKTHNKEAVLAKIRGNIKVNIGDLYDDRKVFLIDNYRRGMYDFDRLEQRIIEEFPSPKRKPFMMPFGTMVRKKAETLRKEIWMTGLASAAVALVPITGISILVDILLILAQSTYYFSQLGLDEKSLKRTAKNSSCDVAILQRIVTEYLESLLTKQGIMAFKRTIPLVALALVAEEGARFIPFIGILMASALSFGTTCFVLDEILKKMEDIALRVVNKAIKNSAPQILKNGSDPSLFLEKD